MCRKSPSIRSELRFALSHLRLFIPDSNHPETRNKMCPENLQHNNRKKSKNWLWNVTISPILRRHQFDKVPEKSFGLETIEENCIKFFYFYLFIFNNLFLCVVCLSLCMFVCAHACGHIYMFLWMCAGVYGVYVDFCVHTCMDQRELPNNFQGCFPHLLRQGLSLSIELTLLLG